MYIETDNQIGPSFADELRAAGVPVDSVRVTTRRVDQQKGHVTKGHTRALILKGVDKRHHSTVIEVLDAHDPDAGLLEDVDRAVEDIAKAEAENRLSNRAYLRKLREAIEVLTPKSGTKSDAVSAILEDLRLADEPFERAAIVKQDVRADPSKRRDLHALFREPRPE